MEVRKAKTSKATSANRLSGLWSRVNLTSDQESLHELGGSDSTDEHLDWDIYDKSRYNLTTLSSPPPPSPPVVATVPRPVKNNVERPKSVTYGSKTSAQSFKRQSKLQTLFRSRESIPSFAEMAEAETKKKKERLCNCCVKAPGLNEHGKLKKFRKCSDCRKEVCDQCFDKDGRCHECYVKMTVEINPKNLLEIPEKVLLHLLKTLHYQEEVFINVQKPFLVKQILTRYQSFDSWDPMFYLQEVSEPQLYVNRQSISSVDSGVQMVKIPEEHPKEPPINTISKTAFMNELENINKKRFTPESERKQMVDIRTTEPPYNRNIVPLHKIATPKYFDGLTEIELRDILRNYSIQAGGDMERHDLKYKVLQLWNIERQKGLDATVKSQGPVYGGKPFKEPSPDRTSQNVKRTISLSDIPSSTSIDSLSIGDMRTLLAKYNRKPENYIMRQDLIYEVRLLWNQAKRQALERQNVINDSKTFTVGPRSTQTLPANRKWKSQDNLDDHLESNMQRSNSQYLQSTPGQQTYREPRVEQRFMETPVSRPYERMFRDDSFPPPPPNLVNREEPFNRGSEYATLPRNYKLPTAGGMPPGMRGGITEPMHQPMVNKTAKKTPPPPPPPLPKTGPPVQQKSSKPQMPLPPQSSLPLQPSLPPQQSFSLKTSKSISLQDIRSPEDISNLSLRQLIHILESHSVDTDGIEEKPYLQEMVTQLWYKNRPVVQMEERPYLSYQMQQQQRYYANSTPGLEQKFESMTMTSSNQSHTYYNRDEQPRLVPQPSYQGGQQFRGGNNERSFSQADLCVICNSRVADAILLDCGHMICCLPCAQRLDACPQCHYQIVKIMSASIK